MGIIISHTSRDYSRIKYNICKLSILFIYKRPSMNYITTVTVVAKDTILRFYLYFSELMRFSF